MLPPRGITGTRTNGRYYHAVTDDPRVQVEVHPEDVEALKRGGWTVLETRQDEAG